MYEASFIRKTGMQNLHLLIVDDSDILSVRLIDVLSEIEGVTIVDRARDVKGAIEAVEKHDLDVVILDIRMPGGNGISALREIKKKEKSPVVIMFTNYPYLQYRKKCLEAGADFFFYKSIEFEKLIELVRNLSSSKPAKKAG